MARSLWQLWGSSPLVPRRYFSTIVTTRVHSKSRQKMLCVCAQVGGPETGRPLIRIVELGSVILYVLFAEQEQ